MHDFHNTLPSIVGLKRQLLPLQIPTQFEDIHKKTKFDDLVKVKLEDSKPTKEPLSPQIPPLLLSNANNNNNNTNGWETLNPLVMLNRVSMIQQYLQLLTLRNYVEQQKDLLSVTRDTSATSCGSYTSISSSNSLSPIKAPLLISKQDTGSSVEIPKFAGYSQDKKNSKVSACKNYIALLCTGFARSILTAAAESEIMVHLNRSIHQKKTKYLSLEQMQHDDLRQFMMQHIHRDICGKRVKKMNKGRDFKVRNTEELEEILFFREGDNDLLRFRKEVLKEMLEFFFTSKSYLEWLENGMINEANKNFFLKNRGEIKKKFNNPTLYKPHFDYN